MALHCPRIRCKNYAVERSNGIVIYLARLANLGKPVDRATFTFRSFFFKFELSSLRIYWTDLHDFFTKWKLFVVVNPVQFFRFLKGRCHGNQFCGKIVAKLLTNPALFTLSFRNGMEYRYLYVRINSINDASISCENLVKFGPVTPELTELICKCQVRHSQKLVHLVEYLWMYRTDFCNLFTIWKRSKCRWWICTLFSNLSRDVAMATK